MAEINIQRRHSSAWIWVLVIVGAIALLWAFLVGFDREPEMLPGTPGVFLIGDPRDFAVADVMSSVPSRHGSGHAPARG
jgi:hypothetical protein